MTTTVIIKAHCAKDKEVCVEITEPGHYGGDYSQTTMEDGEEKEYTIWGDQHSGESYKSIHIYERLKLFANARNGGT